MTDRIYNESQISQQTEVLVTRFVKFSDEKNEHGPMSITKAVKDGLLSSSSGTVSVEIRVSGGDCDGAEVFQKNGKWFAGFYTETSC